MANRIQIKRSIANSVVTGLNTGELAYTANGKILYIGNPVDGASIRIAGEQVPGTLTANQALVANATSGINKVILNQLEFTGAAQKLTANGTNGTSGQVLTSDGTTLYWGTLTADITAVTAGDGLTGGGSSGDITLNVGSGNGISVTADAVAVNLGANSGLVANTLGLFVDPGRGLITNTSGLHVGTGNGITVNADDVTVNANTGAGLVANTAGLYAKVGAGLVFDASGNIAISTTGTINIQDLTVSGNLSVLGDIVTMNVATLSVEDSLITLGSGQATTTTFTDALDLGFVGTYGNTANLFYSGLYRDQSDAGIWKLFTSNGVVSNTNVDTTNSNLFKIATLEAFIKSNGLVSNSTAVTLTANSTVAVNMVANTLTLTTPLISTSGGTGKATMTNNAILVGNSTNGYNELSLGTSGYVLQSNGTTLVYDFLDGGTF
jgi:hypothetical protein